MLLPWPADFYADNGLQALQDGYLRGESDEFLQATIIGGYAGMRDGDGLVVLILEPTGHAI